MKLIDADALIAWMKESQQMTSKMRNIICKIESMPDIVRCQDCKYWVYNFNGCSRNPCTEPWYATDFCNYGEREGE